jgi:hypothetical protein
MSDWNPSSAGLDCEGHGIIFDQLSRKQSLVQAWRLDYWRLDSSCTWIFLPRVEEESLDSVEIRDKTVDFDLESAYPNHHLDLCARVDTRQRLDFLSL